MKSGSDASDANKPYSRTPGSGTPRREAVEQACSKTAGTETGREASRKGCGAAEETTGDSVGAGVVQALQAGMGGDCGPRAECDGNEVCLPVLPEIASRSWSGTWIQKDAACPLGTFAPRRGIEERDGTLTEKGSVR
jgi:hypothetical protein